MISILMLNIYGIQYTSMIQPIPAYNIVGAFAVELELADGKK